MTSTAHSDDCSVSFPDLFALDRSLLAHLFAYFLSWIEQSLYVDRFLSNIAVLFLFLMFSVNLHHCATLMLW